MNGCKKFQNGQCSNLESIRDRNFAACAVYVYVHTGYRYIKIRKSTSAWFPSKMQKQSQQVKLEGLMVILSNQNKVNPTVNINY